MRRQGGEAVRRHDLVYLHPGAAFDAAYCQINGPQELAVRRWIDAGRPLVAARQPAGSAGVVLGLALPLAMDRRRVACRVAPGAIARLAPPLSLSACLGRLPAALVSPLGVLELELARAGLRLGVYGSLAWESLSGEAYRHPDSDIDLICDISTHSQYRAALAILEAAARQLPCRLDGELRFPDGHAVAWQELAACAGAEDAEVLAKGPQEVGLLSLRTLLESLAAEPCHG